MVENLLKEMKFQIELVVNYDPHHIISITIQVNKNKPFQHNEIASMAKSANWLDYPHETQGDEDMQPGSTTSVREFRSPQPDLQELFQQPKGSLL